jgi:hypothetical protein
METSLETKVLGYARNLLGINEQRRVLAENADILKDGLFRSMQEANTGEIIILVGDQEIVIRNNVRFNKPFDKEGLAGETGIEKSELHYAGIASFVDEGEITAMQVEKFQSDNRSEFVTVRVRKVKKKKGRRGATN